MKILPFASAALSILVSVACSEQVGSVGTKPPSQKAGANASAAGASASAAGAGASAANARGSTPQPTNDAGSLEALGQPLVWQTDEFQLAPGQERYLCYAKTLDEDIVAGAYSNVGQRFVHHIIFARTLAPEPDGFSECDTGFRMTWNPLFIAGSGDSKLQFPSDAGHTLPKGTQLLAQLHLLNLGQEPVTAAVAINMYRSSATSPRPVNSYIFGTMDVHLPPGQTTQIVGTCNETESIKLIAAFPHMHMLGKAMRFEVGPSFDAMKEVFSRDPFDFGQQRIDPLVVDLAPGDKARLTCTFDNPTTMQVDYGESTHNEMCYLVGFAVDRSNISACDLFQSSGQPSP